MTEWRLDTIGATEAGSLDLDPIDLEPFTEGTVVYREHIGTIVRTWRAKTLWKWRTRSHVHPLDRERSLVGIPDPFEGSTTKLIRAIRLGRTSEAKHILETCDIDVEDPFVLFTACCLATTEGATRDIVKKLLLLGTDPNRPYATMSPLQMCIELGDVATATVLVEEGADVEEVCCEATTLLGIAVRQRGIRMMKVLLRAGADPLRTLRGGISPLHIAILKGDLLATKLLAKWVEDIDRVEGGFTSLALACQIETKPCIVRALLKAGADPNHYSVQNAMRFCEKEYPGLDVSRK